MAEDMKFDSFENLDDLDWSELEKDLQEERQSPDSGDAEAAPQAQAASSPAAPASAGQIGTGSTTQLELGYLMDVNLQITVEIGKTLSFISGVLGWDRGSIIVLDKLVGEPLSLLINNKRVARGEVVVVNENFALKIIEILDPKDRINYLQS
ncbi:MAG: FliM/FliN family flagellar motor switch protein [SAR324 cluster bacterium]|nr:FliM/FliN family flagellar motor switch protein [SAR324 cluster bacterium]MCZ6628497.1 FliM/FliN family flagellar motor switch protein [SAR324 cluster bacterium]MCZ6647287.1 FliM/FliN family flagellar motor switch protein [SAR324 cluster bacterium]MCZ6728385.1 FliM/FliN family flagellar motor switch protein [SAR324 cluster bacterium]MCZ6841320.1 FliM/FliN family flagellar motor switch protein [SAR324 cluster bacterium]